jgi:hypothetical protein
MGGFFRFGTNTPMKVVKNIKGVKQEKCSKCGDLVDADSLIEGICERCRAKKLKK